jgi:hypothetical protein
MSGRCFCSVSFKWYVINKIISNCGGNKTKHYVYYRKRVFYLVLLICYTGALVAIFHPVIIEF